MKLILKTIGAVAIALSLLFLMELAVGKGLQYNLDNKVSFIAERQAGAEIVLLGDCKMEYNISPELLRLGTKFPVFNLASENANFAENYLYLVQYLKKYPKPKLVCLYAGAASFDSSLLSTFNTYRFAHLMHDPEVRRVTADYDPEYAKTAFVPFLRYSYYSRFVFFKSLKGYLDHWGVTKGTFRHADGFFMPNNFYHQTLFQFHRTTKTINWSQRDEIYLKKIASFLDNQGIKLVLVELPVYHEAKKYMINFEEMDNRVAQLSTALNIPFYRLQHTSIEQDSTSFFSPFNATQKGIPEMNKIFAALLCDTILPKLAVRNVENTIGNEHEK